MEGLREWIEPTQAPGVWLAPGVADVMDSGLRSLTELTAELCNPRFHVLYRNQAGWLVRQPARPLIETSWLPISGWFLRRRVAL